MVITVDFYFFLFLYRFFLTFFGQSLIFHPFDISEHMCRHGRPDSLFYLKFSWYFRFWLVFYFWNIFTFSFIFRFVDFFQIINIFIKIKECPIYLLRIFNFTIFYFFINSEQFFLTLFFLIQLDLYIFLLEY